MGVYTKLPDGIDEVDVIIAGGGTAACVIASRLADVDVNLSILVIESGPDNYNVPTITNPIFLFTHIFPNSTTAIFYKAGRETGVADREVVAPSGGVLGGGSSVNFLTYSRAQRLDFDPWKTPGWSADDMLPYLRKSSSFPGDHTNIAPGQYLALSAFSVYPYSRGSIHITGPGLDNTLDFKTDFFSDAHDVDIKKCVWAYKKQREIFRRMNLYRGELAAGHPPFAVGFPAACIETDAPLGRDVAPLEYTDDDDVVLEDWLRRNVASSWHSLGTYKMAPREESPRLWCRGLENRRHEYSASELGCEY
ncbi:hypothetical protein M426DRAFT_11312 [Hypoxylon sp. CI-4A]|nr:hypothetical protein M426DRAFT_11312 [Hypoxylon sp. CI-4A]